ncbi:MAG: tyrosine-type recombinase/integrase [Lachnospiraceae bacterium]|jgi:integrase|nr:tyrosine-type recombinase/integrase [Anaerovoracaceae bacterium]MEE3462348.1 tyrosine-type recombinase/integrase [Lachnospiraceae bacterium]
MITYISNISDKIEAFLNFKNSLGIKYQAPRSILKNLDRYNLNHENESELSKSLVEGWADYYAARSESQDRSWVSPIREFGRYLNSTGDRAAYILDDRYNIQRYQAEVYLLTEKEIQQFFEECDRFVLRYSGWPGRRYVLPALYRFLYCCGVRCIEARSLKCTEVHLDQGYIDVLGGKALRDRRLFLSDELIKYLKEYDAKISRVFSDREYFFPGGYGGIYSSSAISANFRNIWLSAGLKRDGKVKPRAYDFRHHFACANIMRWSEEGKDIHAMLPYLMRYMGHSSLESTYYYIHLIPDYFSQYRMLTASSADVIPEVDAYEV